MDAIFANIKLRYLLPFYLFGFSGIYFALSLLLGAPNESSDNLVPATLASVISGIVAHAIVFYMLWIFWLSKHKNNMVFHLRISQSDAKGIVLLGIPMVASSIFLYYLLFYPLSFLVPDFVLFWAIESWEMIVPLERDNAIPINILNIILVVLLVPVVEELVFRGFILGRLAHKYGKTVGIVLSSFIFAILHAEVLGTFLFAVFCCLLRFKYESLIAPILLHISNNLIVMVWVATDILVFNIQYEYTIEAFRSELWVAPIGAIIGIPWLIHYYRSKLTGVELGK